MNYDLKTYDGRLTALEQIANTSTDSGSKIAAVEAAARMCWNENNPDPLLLTEEQEARLATARKEFKGE